jgi:hypothetical protein
LSELDSDVLLCVLVRPGASRNQLGTRSSELCVAVTAPPVDGSANKEVTKFLAKLFGVAKGRVSVERGASSRRKVIRVRDFSKQEALAALRAAL